MIRSLLLSDQHYYHYCDCIHDGVVVVLNPIKSTIRTHRRHHRGDSFLRSLRRYWMVVIHIIIICCYSDHHHRIMMVVNGQSTYAVGLISSPNSNNSPCSICAAGAIITEPGATIPNGTLSFILSNILCISLEQSAQGATLATDQCTEVRDNTIIKTLCGCNTLSSPVLAPIPSSRTKTPTSSPSRVTTSTSSPTATLLPTSSITKPDTSNLPTMSNIPTTSSASTILPTNSVINTLVPTPINHSDQLLIYTDVLVQLKSVTDTMLNGTIQSYTTILQKLLSPKLKSSQITDIAVNFINQTLLAANRRRRRTQQQSHVILRYNKRHSHYDMDHKTRKLQASSSTTNNNYPLDTFLNITGYISTNAPFLDRSLFRDKIISIIDQNEAVLIQNLTKLEGFIDSIYFQSLASVNATDPTTMITPTSPTIANPTMTSSPSTAPIPSSPITSSSVNGSGGDSGLSSSAIIGIVVGCSVVVLMGVGYSMYSNARKNNDGGRINTSRHGGGVNRDAIPPQPDHKNTMPAKVSQNPPKMTVPRSDSFKKVTPTPTTTTGSIATKSALKTSNHNINNNDPPPESSSVMNNNGKKTTTATSVRQSQKNTQYDLKPTSSSMYNNSNTNHDTDNPTKFHSVINTIGDIEKQYGRSLSSFKAGDGEVSYGLLGVAAAAPLISGLDDFDDDISSSQDRSRNMVSRTVIAPPGRLGIVIDTTLEGPVVHKVNAGSPLEGLLFPGDIIIAIDDTDTRAMSASAITAIMVRTTNFRRKLTVLTEDDADE